MDNSAKIQECAAQIRDCRQQIENLEFEVRSLEQRKETLLQGHEDVTTKKRLFINDISDERSNLHNMLQIENIQIATRVHEDMNNLFTGMNNQDADHGFDLLATFIRNALDMVEADIRQKRNNIYSLEDTIELLNRQMSYLDI
jgi:chromosome segregation ATPase